MVTRVPGFDTLLKDLCGLGRQLCQSEGGDDGELPRRVIELLVAEVRHFFLFSIFKYLRSGHIQTVPAGTDTYKVYTNLVKALPQNLDGNTLSFPLPHNRSDRSFHNIDIAAFSVHSSTSLNFVSAPTNLRNDPKYVASMMPLSRRR
jgi:hypothetical protein